MKRSLLSLSALAVLALSTQAFAIDKPSDGKQRDTNSGNNANGLGIFKPSTTPSLPKGPASAPAPALAPVELTKLTSAKFSVAEVKALESVSIKFDGVNLGAGKGCTGKVSWTAGGSKSDITLAANGVWGTFGSKVYDTPGTYVATFTPLNYSGEPCASDGPVTATIKVNPPTPLPPSKMTKLVINPTLKPRELLISTKWDGAGNAKAMCSYILNFGDGATKKTGAGPIQPGSDEHHTYAPGTYSVFITPSNADYDQCSLDPAAGPKTFTIE